MAVFAFLEYELDEEARELRRRGASVAVQPKVFELLRHLTRHRERAVPRAELFRRLWPGVRVSDDALYRLVKEARAAVGDNGRDQRVLRTLPGTGFRFVAAAEERLPADARDPRLAGLSIRAAETLAHAAALGSHFDLSLLAEIMREEPAALLVAIDEASAEGCLEPVPEQAGRLRFCGEDLRGLAYVGLSPSGRLEAHRRAAAALEVRVRPAAPELLAEVARHRLETVIADGGREALRALIIAGRDADRRGALDQAATHYEQALSIFDLDPDLPEAERSELLLELASLQRRVGDFGAARKSALSSAESARRQASGELLARSALAVPELLLHGAVDREWVRVAEAALDVLPEATATRSRLLNRMAYQLYWSRDEQRSRACNAEARRIAERGDDHAVLTWVCMIDHMLAPGADSIQARLSLARQAVDHARRAGDADAELYAREQVINDGMELGDLEEVEAQVRAIEHAAEREELMWPGRARTLMALHYGDLSAAERQLTSDQRRREGAPAVVTQYLAPQLLWLRFLQGRLGELVPLLRHMVTTGTGMPIWRAALAMAELEAGDAATAKREYESLAAQDFRDLSEHFLATATLWLFAELAADFGDEARAEVLAGRLEPYAGRLLLVPRASVCLGPADFALGRLAGVSNQEEEARVRLRAALELAERCRARPASARIHAELAEACADSDPQEARRHLERAAELARGLGMASLARRAARAIAS